jgi:hypothetical protein
MRAKNRGTATSQNTKNLGIFAANIVKIAAKIVKIAALLRQNCRISVLLLAQCEISNYEQVKLPSYQSQKQIKTSKTVQE